jgi:hypothetical protein
MNRYFAALALLFVVVCSTYLTSVASPQIAPRDVAMPTGDVWPSLEERIYIPPNALTLNSMDNEVNAPRGQLRQNPRTLGHRNHSKKPRPYRAGISCL